MCHPRVVAQGSIAAENGLDVVPIGIKNEGGVVTLLTQAGRAVVSGASFTSRSVEGINFRTTSCRKSNVPDGMRMKTVNPENTSDHRAGKSRGWARFMGYDRRLLRRGRPPSYRS